MLVSGILGFEIVLLTLIFFVGVLIRHKWKDAEAKKEEIMRLVAMASEEAAMAEVEATVQYGPVSVVGQYQCAVCYSPTTMRCSQCKLARYWFVLLEFLLLILVICVWLLVLYSFRIPYLDC